MKKALGNILKQKEPNFRHVKVDSKVSANRWKTYDVYGRVYIVESAQSWKKGQSVAIQNGRIVESAPKSNEPKRYKV